MKLARTARFDVAQGGTRQLLRRGEAKRVDSDRSDDPVLIHDGVLGWLIREPLA